jgi:hypothetical protein
MQLQKDDPYLILDNLRINKPIGVNTISSSLGTKNCDIKGFPPVPKKLINPWTMQNNEISSQHTMF